MTIKEYGFFLQLDRKMYNLNDLSDSKRVEVLLKKYLESLKDPSQADIQMETNLRWWIQGEIKENPSLVNSIASKLNLRLKKTGRGFEVETAQENEYDWKNEQELKNYEALDETGFWGEKAAGVLPFAISTNRFLFGLRSKNVQEPNTWGIWGGAIDKGEVPSKAALREFKEESGYRGKVIKIKPLSVYRDSDSSFKYFSYILVIPDEFKPRLDWETRKAIWVEYDKWPKPLHPKVKVMLANFKIDSILQSIVDDPR